MSQQYHFVEIRNITKNKDGKLDLNGKNPRSFLDC